MWAGITPRRVRLASRCQADWRNIRRAKREPDARTPGRLARGAALGDPRIQCRRSRESSSDLLPCNRNVFAPAPGRSLLGCRRVAVVHHLEPGRTLGSEEEIDHQLHGLLAVPVALVSADRLSSDRELVR